MPWTGAGGCWGGANRDGWAWSEIDGLEFWRVGVGQRDGIDERDEAGGDVVEGADDGDLAVALHIAQGGTAVAEDGDGV